MIEPLTFTPPTSLRHAVKQRQTLLRNTLALAQVPPDMATMAALVQLGMEIAQANGLSPLALIDLMGKSMGVQLMIDHDAEKLDSDEPEQKIGGQLQ